MKKEFTASVYILDNQKVLLIYHRKLKKWLPPGGHMEENETPPEAARREALEETGLEIAFLPQENTWVDYWNAKSFERPYICLLEEIPTYGDHSAHQHIDFVYVARPLKQQATPEYQGHDHLRWFSLNELNQLQPDQEIFQETLQVIRHLLKAFTYPIHFAETAAIDATKLESAVPDARMEYL